MVLPNNSTWAKPLDELVSFIEGDASKAVSTIGAATSGKNLSKVNKNSGNTEITNEPVQSTAVKRKSKKKCKSSKNKVLIAGDHVETGSPIELMSNEMSVSANGFTCNDVVTECGTSANTESINEKESSMGQSESHNRGSSVSMSCDVKDKNIDPDCPEHAQKMKLNKLITLIEDTRCSASECFPGIFEKKPAIRSSNVNSSEHFSDLLSIVPSLRRFINTQTFDSEINVESLEAKLESVELNVESYSAKLESQSNGVRRKTKNKLTHLETIDESLEFVVSEVRQLHEVEMKLGTISDIKAVQMEKLVTKPDTIATETKQQELWAMNLAENSEESKKAKKLKNKAKLKSTDTKHLEKLEIKSDVRVTEIEQREKLQTDKNKKYIEIKEAKSLGKKLEVTFTDTQQPDELDGRLDIELIGTLSVVGTFESNLIVVLSELIKEPNGMKEDFHFLKAKLNHIIPEVRSTESELSIILAKNSKENKTKKANRSKMISNVKCTNIKQLKTLDKKLEILVTKPMQHEMVRNFNIESMKTERPGKFDMNSAIQLIKTEQLLEFDKNSDIKPKGTKRPKELNKNFAIGSSQALLLNTIANKTNEMLSKTSSQENLKNISNILCDTKMSVLVKKKLDDDLPKINVPANFEKQSNDFYLLEKMQCQKLEIKEDAVVAPGSNQLEKLNSSKAESCTTDSNNNQSFVNANFIENDDHGNGRWIYKKAAPDDNFKVVQKKQKNKRSAKNEPGTENRLSIGLPSVTLKPFPHSASIRPGGKQWSQSAKSRSVKSSAVTLNVRPQGKFQNSLPECTSNTYLVGIPTTNGNPWPALKTVNAVTSSQSIPLEDSETLPHVPLEFCETSQHIPIVNECNDPSTQSLHIPNEPVTFSPVECTNTDTNAQMPASLFHAPFSSGIIQYPCMNHIDAYGGICESNSYTTLTVSSIQTVSVTTQIVSVTSYPLVPPGIQYLPIVAQQEIDSFGSNRLPINSQQEAMYHQSQVGLCFPAPDERMPLNAQVGGMCHPPQGVPCIPADIEKLPGYSHEIICHPSDVYQCRPIPAHGRLPFNSQLEERYHAPNVDPTQIGRLQQLNSQEKMYHPLNVEQGNPVEIPRLKYTSQQRRMCHPANVDQSVPSQIGRLPPNSQQERMCYPQNVDQCIPALMEGLPRKSQQERFRHPANVHLFIPSQVERLPPKSQHERKRHPQKVDQCIPGQPRRMRSNSQQERMCHSQHLDTCIPIHIERVPHSSQLREMCPPPNLDQCFPAQIEKLPSESQQKRVRHPANVDQFSPAPFEKFPRNSQQKSMSHQPYVGICIPAQIEGSPHNSRQKRMGHPPNADQCIPAQFKRVPLNLQQERMDHPPYVGICIPTQIEGLPHTSHPERKHHPPKVDQCITGQPRRMRSNSQQEKMCPPQHLDPCIPVYIERLTHSSQLGEKCHPPNVDQWVPVHIGRLPHNSQEETICNPPNIDQYRPISAEIGRLPLNSEHEGMCHPTNVCDPVPIEGMYRTPVEPVPSTSRASVVPCTHLEDMVERTLQGSHVTYVPSSSTKRSIMTNTSEFTNSNKVKYLPGQSGVRIDTITLTNMPSDAPGIDRSQVLDVQHRAARYSGIETHCMRRRVESFSGISASENMADIQRRNLSPLKYRSVGVQSSPSISILKSEASIEDCSPLSAQCRESSAFVACSSGAKVKEQSEHPVLPRATADRSFSLSQMSPSVPVSSPPAVQQSKALRNRFNLRAAQEYFYLGLPLSFKLVFVLYFKLSFDSITICIFIKFI